MTKSPETPHFRLRNGTSVDFVLFQTIVVSFGVYVRAKEEVKVNSMNHTEFLSDCDVRDARHFVIFADARFSLVGIYMQNDLWHVKCKINHACLSRYLPYWQCFENFNITH